MQSHNLAEQQFPTRATAITLAVSFFYLVFVYLLTGLRIEHVVFVSLYNLLFVLHRNTRKIAAALAIFLVYGMLYDVMKAWPNYLVSEVHIQSLYELEHHIFGIPLNGEILTPNEYLIRNSTPTLDLLTGITYLNWVTVPIFFGLYLLIRDRKFYLQYALTFLLVNIFGFIVYYLLPAAPPWYVSDYGFSFHAQAASSAADLTRFDDIIGLDIFRTIYTRNSNVFAAMPSLHSAYPVVVLYYALVTKRKALSVFAALFTLGIWFTAVYSNHHYVLDVLAGLACAILGLIVFRHLLLKNKGVRHLLKKYEAFIS
jgi:inositol phosphorylceramide synthase catalytic subunit